MNHQSGQFIVSNQILEIPSAGAAARLADFEAAGLFRDKAWVAGCWIAAASGDTIPVSNPSDNAVLGAVPALSSAEALRAVDAARSALSVWRALLPDQRGDILRRWYELILENKEALAVLMTLEQGKPLVEARGEIDYAAGFVRWFAEEGARLYGETIPGHLPQRKLLVQREPIGVVAAITPWNFPAGMLTRKAAAALAAGCTVVAVPSVETPYSALALAALAEEAGLPEGVMSVLTGDPQEVVPPLCASPVVRAVSFTGSTEIGRLVSEQCAPTIKKLSLELGGHAPFVVFPDVDIDDAIAAAIDAKFQTSGQDCLAANRIFVHRDIYEEFVAGFTRSAENLVVGDGFSDSVDIGPLIGRRAVEKCRQQLANATSRGARVTTKDRPSPGSNFFMPTVLADVDANMQVFRDETFGPLAALIPFDDEAAVVAAANDTEYGLIAYVFTSSNQRIWRLNDALEYGMVAINTVKVTGAPIPFGGVKQSGLGREGARQGIEEFTELKYTCMATGTGAVAIQPSGI